MMQEINTYEPLVSIVIPAYKASNYLAEAIDSALNQTYKNIEIIVVNDGSPDDGATREVAMRYGDRIRYFEKTNGGSSSALNYGIREMKGEWFSWLSHDDLYLPEKVQTQIDFLNQQENLRERFVLFSGSELIDAQRRVIHPYHAEADQKKAETINKFDNNHWLIADQIKTYVFHGCSCFVHKSVFEEIGVFDESLRLVNDIDMWLRIFKHGYTIRYMPKCLVQGRMHGKQVSREIGFSYHNPEQDRYWNQVYEYLCGLKGCADWEKLMYSYACTAMQRTRSAEGRKAFAALSNEYPKKRIQYALFCNVQGIFGNVREMAKAVYIRFILK